jgi:hypothetical protein
LEDKFMIAALLSALLLAPEAPATNAPPQTEVARNEDAPKKQRKVCKIDESDTFSKIRRRVCKVEDERSSGGGSRVDDAS